MQKFKRITLLFIFAFCVQVVFSQSVSDSTAEYLGLIDYDNSFYDYKLEVENEATTGDGREITKLSKSEILLMQKALKEYNLKKGGMIKK